MAVATLGRILEVKMNILNLKKIIFYAQQILSYWAR